MQNVLSLIYLILIVPCTLIKIYFMFGYYVQGHPTGNFEKKT